MQTNDNIYRNLNKQYFDELLQITIARPIQYANVIRGKKYLLAWIDKSIPKLLNEKYDLRTKIYWIVNGLQDFPKCKNCGKSFEGKNIRKLQDGYGIFCSTICANKNIEHNNKIKNTRDNHLKDDPNFLTNITKKTKLTKLKKYGNENYTNREKATITIQKKYGSNWFVETEQFKKKAAQTCFEHYGVDCSFKSLECRDKAKLTCIELYGNPNYRNIEKYKLTCLKKYGVDNPVKVPEIYDKIRKSFIEHYGVDNNMKSPKGYAEWQNGVMKIYGVEHNWKADIVKEHTCQTNIKKYGTPHPSSCKYEFDNNVFDSSWELAYYIWLKDNEIKFDYHPSPIQYFVNKEKHNYEPDFKLLDENQFIEIKGPHLIDVETGKFINIYGNINQEQLDAKMKCLIENNVKIYSTDEMMPIFSYIHEIYGGINYLKKFKKQIFKSK